MKVLAASQVHGPAGCSEKLLKSYLQPYISAPRRVDQLILQALLGGALLLPELQKNCGLYLSAHFPCTDTMGRLLDNVILHEKLPKPLEFVNSVSNAAGFYLAQKLGLEGPNLFIGAAADGWQKLCQLAAVDLAEGVCQQALLIHCHNPADFVIEALLLDAQAGGIDSCSFASLSQGVELKQLKIQPQDALTSA